MRAVGEGGEGEGGEAEAGHASTWPALIRVQMPTLIPALVRPIPRSR